MNEDGDKDPSFGWRWPEISGGFFAKGPDVPGEIIKTDKDRPAYETPTNEELDKKKRRREALNALITKIEQNKFEVEQTENRDRNVRKELQRLQSERFQKKMDRQKDISTASDFGLPGDFQVETQTYPYTRMYDIRKTKDGESQRIPVPDLHAPEIQWYNDRKAIREFAKKTGRFELVVGDPDLSEQDATEILARKAQLETNKTAVAKERDEALIRQRANELATGELGRISDPETTVEYIQAVMSRKHQIEAENASRFNNLRQEATTIHEIDAKAATAAIQSPHALHQTSIMTDILRPAAVENQGFFSKIKKIFQK